MKPTIKPNYEAILSRAVAPGLSSPAYAPRQARVSAIREARKHQGEGADAVEALRIMADRVSDCVRLHAERLMAAGAIDYNEAQEIIWEVERAAGAATHCTPGYGPYDMSILDSGGLGKLSGKMGTRVLLGDHRRTSETAATARGLLTQLAKGHYAHGSAYGTREEIIRENFEKLTDAEQRVATQIADDLIAATK